MMLKKITRFAALTLAILTLFCLAPAANADGDQSTAATTDGTSTAIRLMPEDLSGTTVPAAEAKHKEAVRILLPLKCVEDGITDLSVCPVVGDVAVFPFNVTKQDYTKFFKDLYPNEVDPQNGSLYEFSFHFSIHNDAPKGTVMVAFLLKFKDSAGVDQEETISIPVTVLDTPAGTGSSGSKSGARLTPKVIIEGFAFDPMEVFAGDQFELAIDLINTSNREAVRNMQVSISDASGVVMPSANGSNTQYIERIEISGSKKGNTKALIFPMQIVPDAEPKSVLLTVDIVYNGASTKEEYKSTETIAVPVQQRQRVRFSAPVVYDEAWVDQSVSMSAQMFNLGKSPIYNTEVTVTGDGLAMEEAYFGGNISAGSAMRAEFNVIPSVGGDVSGEVVVTYEDVYGRQTEERLPFTLFVNEAIAEVEPADPMAMMEEQPPEDTTVRIFGIPWYLLAAGIAALAAVIVLLIVRARKKRAKELMEL